MENITRALERIASIRALAPVNTAAPPGFAAALDAATAAAAPADHSHSSHAAPAGNTALTFGHWTGVAATPPPLLEQPPGAWASPVPGRVTSKFGRRLHPILGVWKMHTGVDMSGKTGTPIIAVASGKVTHSGPRGGYGNLVTIEHAGGLETRYAHQSKVAVSVGDRVLAGQVIGYVGSTGMSTGPHLHFEVRQDGNPVDPLPYLSRVGV